MPPTNDSSPEAIVRSFLRMLGRHDVQAAMSLLDDDFTFRSADGSFAADRGSMPAMLAWDAEAESRVEIEQLRRSGDTVRARLVERSRFTELLGLEPWTVDATFVVRDGRIEEEVAREVTDGPTTFTERFVEALEPVRRWAAETRPGDAGAVFPEGHVARYDGPTARRLLDLIEAYRRRREDGT